MKYVIFKHKKTGLLEVVLVSPLSTHSEISLGKGAVPVYAGFYAHQSLDNAIEQALLLELINGNELQDYVQLMANAGVSCFGSSRSLKLSSRRKDVLLCYLTVAGLDAALLLVQDYLND